MVKLSLPVKNTYRDSQVKERSRKSKFLGRFEERQEVETGQRKKGYRSLNQHSLLIRVQDGLTNLCRVKHG